MQMITTDTLIILKVVNKTSAFGTCENMDTSRRHAEAKSGARKNTQVTLMRKKVSIANNILPEIFFFGVDIGIPDTPPDYCTVARTGTGAFLNSSINFSTHK